MKSKISLYTVIGILIFILVATICPDCADRGSREELEWQKSKKIADSKNVGISEEEAYEAAKKEIEKEELDAEIFEDSGDEYLNGDDGDDEDREEQEKIEREQAATEAEPEEEERLIPDEPITYSGDLWDVGIDLIVDFKTKVVSGSLSQSGDPYVNAKIDGTINIETFKVTTTFSGVVGAPEYGKEEPFNGTINGIISDDLSTFNGILLDDEGESGEITLTK